MSILEEIIHLFPVRKKKGQKAAFRKWFLAEAAALGYSARVEQNGNGRHQNIVLGDPDHAALTVSAHYDTPTTVLLPDLLIPRNMAVYGAYQLGVILLMLVISLAMGLLLGTFFGGKALLLGFFLTFLLLMWLQLYGFANPNNVNASSGLAAVMEIMARVPAEDRAKVAFLLFDNSESGRQGSKAFGRDHIEMQHTRLVIDLDAVGKGDHFLVAASRVAEQHPAYPLLEKAFGAQSARATRFVSSWMTRLGGDWRSFVCSVGICACEQVSGVGLMTGRLHTPADVEAEQENLAVLADTLAKFIRVL